MIPIQFHKRVSNWLNQEYSNHETWQMILSASGDNRTTQLNSPCPITSVAIRLKDTDHADVLCLTPFMYDTC